MRNIIIPSVVAALVALFVSSGALAAGKRQDKKQLAEGEELYFGGSYEEALFILEELAARPKVDKKLRVKALKYIAFCYFLLDAKDQAEGAWRRLLDVEPTFQLNAVEESPEFVNFFNPLKGGSAAKDGAPSESSPGGSATASTSSDTVSTCTCDTGDTCQEGCACDNDCDNTAECACNTQEGTCDEGCACDPNCTSAAASDCACNGLDTCEESCACDPDCPQSKVTKKIPPPEVTHERGCGIALCLLPVGIGQFANGQVVKGVIFAILQPLLLGLNIGFYYWNQGDIISTSNGAPVYRDPAAAQDRYIAQLAFFGGFVGAVVLGIIDAFVFY